MMGTSCKLCGKTFVCNNGMWFTTCDCAKDRPDELQAAQSAPPFVTPPTDDELVELERWAGAVDVLIISRDRRDAFRRLLTHYRELRAENDKGRIIVNDAIEELDQLADLLADSEDVPVGQTAAVATLNETIEALSAGFRQNKEPRP